MKAIDPTLASDALAAVTGPRQRDYAHPKVNFQRIANLWSIILDEAQNTTAEQMKMFLTRLGFGSKIVVTGDVTQVDLPDGRGRSGLLAVRPILEGIEGLAFCDLASGDVVRHRIVQDIVDAYERVSS